MTLLDVVLGRGWANREQQEQKIGWFEGVPAMGLDGLGSSSGPEAALTLLIPLGAASLAWIGWAIAPTLLQLGILSPTPDDRGLSKQRRAYAVAKQKNWAQG